MSDRTTSAIERQPIDTYSSSSITFSGAMADKGAKICSWPAAFFLAVIPTTNIQPTGNLWSVNETCVRTYRRKGDLSFSCNEIYSSWYTPSWEHIGVPRIGVVNHVRAKLKFRGELKWQPYEP
jgi:hypothetical protein